MTLDRRTFLTTSVVSMLGMLVGCVSAPRAGETRGAPGDGTPVRKTVDLTDDLTFDPDSIAITTGGTIVWENVGSVAHTVTAYADGIPDGAAYFASGGFDSEAAARQGFPDGSIEADQTFEHTFETSGEFQYFCIPHETAGMKGSIEVQ